jgi:L-fuconolactonase
MKIDSHQHFWKYSAIEYPWMGEELACCRRDLLPDDLAPLLDASGLDGSIAVQARQIPEETDFLLDLAEKHPRVLGVVGWIPLCSPDVGRYLEQYAAHPKIVGFRHVIQDEPDHDFILRPDFQAGIRELGRYPLCYDVLIFEKHLPQTITFADQHPQISLVLDHIAKPEIHVNEFSTAWAKNIRQLAEREHVTCKLSGMVTEVWGGAWDADMLRPYFDTVLEAFGPQRLMFGSDWPVCLMRSSHRQWVETVTSWIAPLSADEQASIMGGTAARVYGLV